MSPLPEGRLGDSPCLMRTAHNTVGLLNERREQGVQPCLDGLEALLAEQAADMRL